MIFLLLLFSFVQASLSVKHSKTTMATDLVELNYLLRKYSADQVKIEERDVEWANGLLRKYVKGTLHDFMAINSDIPFRSLEYTGSHYEGLKTEAADEIDIMVMLDASKYLTVEKVEEIPGWAKMKVKNNYTPFNKFANKDGYVKPDKIRSWLMSLVTRAKNTFEEDGAISFGVRQHGPAVQIDITEAQTGKLLSIDLVLSCHFGHDYYVVKPFKASSKSIPDHEKVLLMRQSFSVEEKSMLKNMDKKDSGCRHELLRIVKTIVRNDSALKGKITSYHLKTAFLRYNEDKSLSWDRNDLSQRFLGYIKHLVKALQEKKLPHFFIPDVNLVEDVRDIVIHNMVTRLERLINNDKERNKVLKVPEQYLAKKMDNLSITAGDSSRTLGMIRRFLSEMGSASRLYAQPCKDIFNRVVKDRILKNCQMNSELISTFDYAGNLHEGLLTENQDDDDAVVIVFLKTKKNNGDVKPEIHKGYAKFKVMQGSYYMQFSENGEFVNPAKVSEWFFKQVQREVQKCSGFDISMTPPQPGKNHVVKLTIKMSLAQDSPKSTLTINILPAFMVEQQVFVPLEPLNAMHKDSNKWRQSFAREKKSMLQNMDTDAGHRHDLYKVATTVLKREPTFSPLLAHIKMMFIVYINKLCSSCALWDKDMLDERFDGFMEFIAESLQNKVLSHHWLTEVNLLSGIPVITLHNMEKRIQRILSSQQEKEKVLTYSQ